MLFHTIGIATKLLLSFELLFKWKVQNKSVNMYSFQVQHMDVVLEQAPNRSPSQELLKK